MIGPLTNDEEERAYAKWEQEKRELRYKDPEAFKQRMDKDLEYWKILDKKIDEEIAREKYPDPTPEQIITETPPLPELNPSKFRIERGNDEIAMWLRAGRESGHINETMIGINLIDYQCPMSYESVLPCGKQFNSFQDLFHHFKNEHYDERYILRQAKELWYNSCIRNIGKNTSDNEKKAIRHMAANPSPGDLEDYIKILKNRSEWKDIAYGMLQQCFVYEANNKGRRTRAKYEKRAAVTYRFQKTYGLITSQIWRIFDIYSITKTRQIIYDGLMVDHGKKEENLPAWMQRALKQSQ